MKFYNQAWFHKVATVAATVGAFAAAHWIPATLTIALGPVGIPIAAAIEGAVALLAAAGIAQSPSVAKVLAIVPTTPRPPVT